MRIFHFYAEFNPEASQIILHILLLEFEIIDLVQKPLMDLFLLWSPN